MFIARACVYLMLQCTHVAAHIFTSGVWIDFTQLCQFILRYCGDISPVICVLPLLHIHINLDILYQILQILDR